MSCLVGLVGKKVLKELFVTGKTRVGRDRR